MHKKEVEIAQQVVEKLPGRFDHEVYLAWLDPDAFPHIEQEDVVKFDDATIEFLTQPVYDRFSSLARINDKLLYALGLGPSTAAGISLK
jgi:hypothetical protein